MNIEEFKLDKMEGLMSVEMSEWKWYVDTDEDCQMLIVDAPFGSWCMYFSELSTAELIESISEIIERMWKSLDAMQLEKGNE